MSVLDQRILNAAGVAGRADVAERDIWINPDIAARSAPSIAECVVFTTKSAVHETGIKQRAALFSFPDSSGYE